MRILKTTPRDTYISKSETATQKTGILRVHTFSLNQAERAPGYEPPKHTHVFASVRLNTSVIFTWKFAKSANLHRIHHSCTWVQQKLIHIISTFKLTLVDLKGISCFRAQDHLCWYSFHNTDARPQKLGPCTALQDLHAHLRKNRVKNGKHVWDVYNIDII